MSAVNQYNISIIILMLFRRRDILHMWDKNEKNNAKGIAAKSQQNLSRFTRYEADYNCTQS